VRHDKSFAKVTLVIAALMSLLTASPAVAACTEPRYQTGRDFTNDQLGLVALHVAVDRSDLSVERLACLAEHLRDRNPHWKRGSVLIFGSLSAARDFVGGNVEVPYQGRASNPRQQAVLDAFWDSQRQLRATYAFDVDKAEQSLTISPFGTVGAELGAVWDTTFRLPLRGSERCRLELKGRCVMSIGRMREYPIPYPAEALRRQISGAVTVTATVARDGSITVGEVSKRSSGTADDTLETAAVENLKTWLVEPSARGESIRITYSYTIDRSLMADSPSIEQRHVVNAEDGRVQVTFDLPDRITIRGFPRSPGVEPGAK
jgi:TonB family protein